MSTKRPYEATLGPNENIVSLTTILFENTEEQVDAHRILALTSASRILFLDINGESNHWHQLRPIKREFK